MRIILRFFAVAGACLAVFTSGAASTFVQLDIEELTLAADRGIVRGRVLQQTSAWNEARTMIWTEVTVQVLEDLAGTHAPGDTVVYRVPGGRVGADEIRMQGAPEFAVGEEMVLFGTIWPDGSGKVLGYYQGASRVRTASDSGPILRGGSADGMTLEVFREQVRRTLVREGRP